MHDIWQWLSRHPFESPLVNLVWHSIGLLIVAAAVTLTVLGIGVLLLRSLRWLLQRGIAHTFWVNRNYLAPRGHEKRTGSILKAGEFHWRYDAHCTIGGHVSWHWGTRFCHLEFKCDTGDGYDFVLSLGIPWVLSLWFVHSMPRWCMQRLPQHHFSFEGVNGRCEGSYPESREISLRIHHWTLWWTLWMSDNEWRSTDPKWRRGAFHFDRLLFGRQEYACEPIGTPWQGGVWMPEGMYPVLVTKQRETWFRSRGPWQYAHRTRVSCDVRCEIGIPFPGKGENSWDCGDDALFATAIATANIEEACQQFGHIVLEYRQRYGGQQCAEAPWPQTPADRLRDYEARAAHREAARGAKAVAREE